VSESQPNQTSGEQEFRWPETFAMIGWAGIGGTVLKSWSSVLAADTGMKVKIAPELNTVKRFKFTGRGLFQLTAGGTTETRQMLMADRKYSDRDTGPWPIRAVWAQSKSHSGQFVRGDSHIRDIYDIKPRTRMADMLSYAASTRIVDAFLAWAKVDPKDIVWVPANNYQGSVKSLVDGEVDVCFGIPTSPAVYEAEKNPHGIRWIDMNSDKDPEGAKRFMAVDPLVSFGPMFNGVSSCIGRWGTIGTSLYTTHAETDPELVYRLAKWMDKNWERYKDLHPWNKYMTCDILMEELNHTFIPSHDGLIKYLKEKGLWTESHERRQEKNADLITRYCQAYQEAIEMADEELIKIDPENKEWADLWENHKKQLGIPLFKLYSSLEE